MQLGIFDHMDRSRPELGQQYQDRFRLIEACDRAGFYAFHLAEHHATPLGLAPSPSIFLSALAQRTTRIRLATMVYVLPLHHPLRLAEEICMVDQLSGGRFEIGVGRGISHIELSYYGIDPTMAREIYVEALAVLRQALTEPVVNFTGKHFRYRDVPTVLRPMQRPHPPFWYGVGNA